MKNLSLKMTIVFLLAIPLLTASLSVANSPIPLPENGADDGGYGGFFGPGGGFGIPGFGKGWDKGIIGGGYGSGYGGSGGGGYSKGGIVRRAVVCKAPGPCYKKKLICPAKCFTSFSQSGKGFGAGGGGGGCTIDCQKSCTAYC